MRFSQEMFPAKNFQRAGKHGTLKGGPHVADLHRQTQKCVATQQIVGSVPGAMSMHGCMIRYSSVRHNVHLIPTIALPLAAQLRSNLDQAFCSHLLGIDDHAGSAWLFVFFEALVLLACGFCLVLIARLAAQHTATAYLVTSTVCAQEEFGMAM
jgi:hypothetical protein